MKAILLILILTISSCTYEPFIPKLIQTTTPTKITAYSACIGGQNLIVGALNEAGIVLAEHPNPDLNDYKVIGSGGGRDFTADLCDLKVGTVYYARAYITGKYATIYGNTVIFKTLEK